MSAEISITANVVSDNPLHAARAAEAFARVAAGLVLDGVQVSMDLEPVEYIEIEAETDVAGSTGSTDNYGEEG